MKKIENNGRLWYKQKDIGMEFGIERCAMRIMKTGKRQITEGIELPNQERISGLEEKENYKFLGIQNTNTKPAKMKEKMRKEYLRRTRKPLETKVYSRILIKGSSPCKILGIIPKIDK